MERTLTLVMVLCLDSKAKTFLIVRPKMAPEIVTTFHFITDTPIVGFSAQTKGFGIGFDYTNLTPFLRSYVTSDNAANDPKINVTCPFSSVDTSTHSVEILYSLQYTPALFQIYLDNSLVYSSRNKLILICNRHVFLESIVMNTLLGGNTAYAGFRGSFSATGKQTNHINNGTLPEDPTALSIQVTLLSIQLFTL